jgi:signal transduction histidine kinase
VGAAAERLSKLLSAYRMARQENSLSLLAVDVGHLISDVVLRVRESGAAGTAITSECRYDGFWICDRELVSDCLVNALQNALRHARCQVRLEAIEVDGRLAFTVADDGPGFPDERQGDADGKHSGVGLFIARRIAQLHERQGHHGELRLTNGGPLGGGCFELRLP